MGNVLVSLLILSVFTPAPAIQRIERAFLQNNSGLLRALLPQEGRVNLSFPEPILFSDQLSDQQTYFFVNNLFQTYATLEFYPERRTLPPGQIRYIFKARWSFQDQANTQYPLNLFFHLELVESSQGSDPEWKIMEIRAETI